MPHATDSTNDDQALFQEILLEHGNHPRHSAIPANSQCVVETRDPLKGDRVRLGAIWDGSGRLSTIGVEASGSTVLKASCSLMSETLLGLSRKECAAAIERFLAMLADPAQSVTIDDWGELAALSAIRRFPARVQCASMPWRLAAQILEANLND